MSSIVNRPKAGSKINNPIKLPNVALQVCNTARAETKTAYLQAVRDLTKFLFFEKVEVNAKVNRHINCIENINASAASSGRIFERDSLERSKNAINILIKCHLSVVLHDTKFYLNFRIKIVKNLQNNFTPLKTHFGKKFAWEIKRSNFP